MRTINTELKDLALFTDLSRTERALVAQQLTLLTRPAGTVLMREGEPGREFFVFVEGQAEVLKGGKVIATVGRGDHVGEMALLTESARGVRNATVRALTDVAFFVSSRAEFRLMISVSPRMAEKVNQAASSRALVAA
jgi:CRP/FNR family transcriptional regulator, cyclic AMP receptor protein